MCINIRLKLLKRVLRILS